MYKEKLQHFIFQDLENIFEFEKGYYNNEIDLSPWDQHGLWHKQLIADWEAIKADLMELFKNRQGKQTLPQMKKASSLLLQFVYWTNNSPVDLSNWSTVTFKHAPVNFKERTEFIFLKPTLHHSMIQIGEMFQEFEKQYEKALALKKL